jgi:hypothetical protein
LIFSASVNIQGERRVYIELLCEVTNHAFVCVHFAAIEPVGSEEAATVVLVSYDIPREYEPLIKTYARWDEAVASTFLETSFASFRMANFSLVTSPNVHVGSVHVEVNVCWK